MKRDPIRMRAWEEPDIITRPSHHQLWIAATWIGYGLIAVGAFSALALGLHWWHQ